MSIYLELTREFNAGATRAILSSGQAVVLHRLAVASKDGDWILREDPAALQFVLEVLASHGARYRFGAPLDVRWMRGGWSAHFEFRHPPPGDPLAREPHLRVRTDFVTRPPRLSESDIDSMWVAAAAMDLPYLDVRRLIAIKLTNREKDYAVVGELARLMTDPVEQLLHSRSARDILSVAQVHPQVVADLAPTRTVLRAAGEGLAALERALDAERRALMHANERRLAGYLEASRIWGHKWLEIAATIDSLPLPAAHRVLIEAAAGVLPFEPAQEAA